MAQQVLNHFNVAKPASLLKLVYSSAENEAFHQSEDRINVIESLNWNFRSSTLEK